MKINRLLAEARLELGSYVKVAEKLGVSKSKISDIRAGRQTASEPEVLMIAEMAKRENPLQELVEVMSESDKEYGYLWSKYKCARRESNPRPSASETYRVQQFIKFMYVLLNLLNRQLRHIAHNPNGHSASYFQYRHALTNL